MVAQRQASGIRVDPRKYRRAVRDIYHHRDGTGLIQVTIEIPRDFGGNAQKSRLTNLE